MPNPVEQDFIEGEADPYDPLDTERAHVTTLHLQQETNSAIVDKLERRRQAYCRMISALLPEDRDIILQDLSWFCMGDRAVFHENERVHVLLTGRQEVWQRIQDHIRLSPDDLKAKYIKPQPEE